MIRRLSRVTGMVAGTTFGLAISVYGAGLLVSQCLRTIVP